ncbi:AAA family ATPase [Sphingobacterium sp. UDSM-2020]|uniref:AAA family ATPase n=1 Tax=Sphingobacterium sp. UDSM-2020 TaxID=2795738 RepID=UPI0019387399|nr:AAA family ATPase [Sphingobacterium sp. UDSM-2020]QQD15060.1 AAA family ATPase [Sphingobacterium sp. UDSM-2020]
MSTKPKIAKYKALDKLAIRLRDDLNDNHFVLLYAYNGTGKTRLSMEFKERGKRLKGSTGPDTLYFNAFTEDLFSWDNDLDNNTERVLEINSKSKFFNGLRELALEEKIFAYLERYAEFDFKIDYDEWTVTFNKEETTHIKISRGEENIFIWCLFLSICELAIDGAEAYNWVKYIYIDDPISSLDDNNAIAVASDLAHLLKKGKGKVKVVISSHHALFFNVICNELKNDGCKRHFLLKNGNDGLTLRATDDTPFFHHVAILSELKQVMESGKINTYHFNMLRSILEKTGTFFGYDDFSKCIYGIEDEVLYSRALNLLSHGKYSIYEPQEMGPDTKDLFIKILKAFLDKYQFELPEMLVEKTVKSQDDKQGTTTAG